MSEIEPQKPINPYAGPQSSNGPVTYQPAHNPNGGDSTGGLIPYKNPKALIAYYLGILSGLPLIGFPIGIAAFVLGIMGLSDRKKNPAIKGSVHAGIGIGCGLIFTLLWGGVILIGIVAMISASSVRR
jgi:hypothetical protein